MRILTLFFTTLFSISVFAQSTFTFDKNHTFVTWSVSHFDYSDVTGKIYAEGTLQWNEKNPEKSTFTISANISTITSGVEHLDKELVGRNYFDAEKFPTATFVAKKITKTGNNKGVIDGNVTIKGVTKPMSLSVTLRKSDIHPYYKRPALGFIATGKLNRSDFGIRAYLPGVSDEVKLEIHAEAIQNIAKES